MVGARVSQGGRAHEQMCLLWRDYSGGQYGVPYLFGQVESEGEG